PPEPKPRVAPAATVNLPVESPPGRSSSPDCTWTEPVLSNARKPPITAAPLAPDRISVPALPNVHVDVSKPRMKGEPVMVKVAPGRLSIEAPPDITIWSYWPSLVQVAAPALTRVRPVKDRLSDRLSAPPLATDVVPVPFIIPPVQFRAPV